MTRKCRPLCNDPKEPEDRLTGQIKILILKYKQRFHIVVVTYYHMIFWHNRFLWSRVESEDKKTIAHRFTWERKNGGRGYHHLLETLEKLRLTRRLTFPEVNFTPPTRSNEREVEGGTRIVGWKTESLPGRPIYIGDLLVKCPKDGIIFSSYRWSLRSHFHYFLVDYFWNFTQFCVYKALTIHLVRNWRWLGTSDPKFLVSNFLLWPRCFNLNLL